MRFSANLGYLWADLPLPGAIRAAARHGFDAVECHHPYKTPISETLRASQETGLPMLGINTRVGSQNGDFGLAAVPGREEEAQTLIQEAIDYAAATETKAVHVLAGIADGTAARDAFQRNLVFACDQAEEKGITILIEPLNPFDVPGYALSTTAQAIETIEGLGRDNLKLMFDFYHVHRTEGDVLKRLETVYGHIGHIQFAGPPHRGWPDRGELDFVPIFEALETLGWDQPIGAEYKPDGPTEASLGWMKTLRPKG